MDTILLVAYILIVILLIIGFFAIEWLGRENKYAIEKLGFQWYRIFRWSFYSFIVFCIGMYMKAGETAFIYFQF